ncbi:hypothetical protein GOP47_0024570 [Adiantum capillus-veneris]|uniref:Golgi apparatus membrane protein TVP15 n=1 Tax=Adiantum capillus-veneris TaxID=13818 RepID=A0A9D4U384_ADICA|nr:hypothetical protein GOP47_0024570 [Adiantum capillus-veneris]
MSSSNRDPELLPQDDDTPPQLDLQHLKRGDPFLVVCRCFSGLAVISAILCVVANVFSAIHAFKTGNDIFGGILRCYAIVIALFVAVAETEWQRIFQFWKILEYWAGRGMLQVFVGVMTRALSDLESGGQAMVILQQVSSYMLLACGLVYIITGILCIGHLKRARMKKAESREQALRDLEELENRRKELQSLLGRRS